MKIISKNGEVNELTMWNFPKIEKPEMTCFQADIEISYHEIVAIFGDETLDGDGYKVQAEWHVITPAGFATIYDYKQGKNYCGDEGIPKTKVTDWHIGGESKAVVPFILSALGFNQK